MVSPLMNISRVGENRKNNLQYTPVGTPFISPTSSITPSDSRMTPIRKSLFQRRRVTSNRRRKESFITPTEEDSRDDSNEIESLRSANKKKDGHLKMLHDRFTSIQKGLGSIDEERNELVEKVKRLDKEKKLIQKQLELREREILTLIKRCASQEEKMRESSKLRSANRKLQSHLEEMAAKLLVIEEETNERQNVKKLLQDSELEREQLRDRLGKVQREHDDVTDTLQEYLTSIRQLTEEKQLIEEDLMKERKRAEMELENQHLAHVDHSNNLKENLREHQSRILEMENLLQDKIKSNTDLRREKAVLSQGQHEELQEVVEKYERQLKELRKESDETIMEKESGSQDLEQEVSFMKKKLRTKDDMLQELETQFSDQMVKLISKQSSLDEAEEEKRDLESKVEASEKLEIEHSALLDYVKILDSNLAEVTTANAYLELEKDALREESDELRKKANILQKQFSSLHNNQKAKEGDFRELLNAEKEELRIELQESLRLTKSQVAALQAELKAKNGLISKLEVDLNQARSVIADKEDEINRIMTQMEHLRSTLGADLRRARLQGAQFEAEVFAKNQRIATLEGRLEGAKQIQEMGQKFEKNSDRSESAEVNKDSEYFRIELEGTIQDVRNEAMFLQQKIESLLKEKSKLEEEVDQSRGLINDRDEQIVEVQQTILKLKKSEYELERKLQQTTKALQDYKEKLSTIQENDLPEPSQRNVKSQDPAKPDTDADAAHLDKSINSYDELEERIHRLENDLLKAKISQSEASAILIEAQKRIEELEGQLIVEDKQAKSLEKLLQNATNDLMEEKSKASTIENEYHKALELKTEGEEEEKSLKIMLLEDKIENMKKQMQILDTQINEYKTESVGKNEIISSLKDEVSQSKEKTNMLLCELDSKDNESEKFLLLQKEVENNLQTKIETTNSLLRSKKDRIIQLEELLASEEDNCKILQESLSKTKDKIVSLENRLSGVEKERVELKEQIKGTKSTSTNTIHVDDDFLPSSDERDLKHNIQVLLTQKSELRTELDRTKSTLEEERDAWIMKGDKSYKELSIYKAKLLVLQNVLIERERFISSLQKGETDTKNHNLIAETHSSDAKNVISNLKEQIESNDKKPADFENQFTEDGIKYAFVESDKRRLEIEDDLTLAKKNLEELKVNDNTREQQLNEVEEQLERSLQEITEKNEQILLMERRCDILKTEAKSLNEKLCGEKAQFLNLENELDLMKTKVSERDEIIVKFNASTQSLNEIAEKANDEITHKNDVVAKLTKSTNDLEIDLEKAKNENSKKDDNIRCLEDNLKFEKESRMKLEGEIEVTREYIRESQKMKEDLKKELEVERQGRITNEENLTETKKDLESLEASSREHISKLEERIAEMSDDLNRKDNEIRGLRTADRMEPKEKINSLTKEVTLWKADALKKDLEYSAEKKEYLSQIEVLKSELQTLSLNAKDDDENRDALTDSLKKDNNSLQSSIAELESSLKQSNERINQRDVTIEELKKSLVLGAEGESEIRKQCDALQKAESEAREDLENIKAEYERAAEREKELTEMRIRNKDSLHKEELESALSEFESTLNKLQDSENLLIERGYRLGEMVDHNRDLELELQKEQKERREMEDLFSQEQNKFETVRDDLRKLQAELRRKESTLESKLKEERNKKEFAEESLRIARTKYKEAMKSKRNATQLERENNELKDKIRRQEAYLQRKLQKEKNDRVRSTPGRNTPSKSTPSPGKSALKTPNQRITGASARLSTFASKSRIQAPSTIGRGISTVSKSRSKISPTVASCRSTRTTQSTFSRNTLFQTPLKHVPTLSAQDILQSELDSDRSTSSELSSILNNSTVA